MQTILKNEVLGPFLDDDDVLKIAQHRMVGPVSLAAFDCNWTTSPEKNYFNVWAVVSFHQRTDKVFLQGGRFCHWNMEYEMKLVSTKNNVSLYRLSLHNADDFPNEFVLRLERENGEHIYDNNNYSNFSIEHSQGHSMSAIAQGAGIFSFESIISAKVMHS